VTTAALSSLTEAGGRQQGLDRSNSCPSARHRRSSDGHDITPAGCQDLSGCHIGMYLGRQLSPARHVALCYTPIVHLGVGRTRRPRDSHLSHARLRPPRSLPPLCSPTHSTHLGWGTRHSLIGLRDTRSRNADNGVADCSKMVRARCTRDDGQCL
jgi:hypothetical protein